MTAKSPTRRRLLMTAAIAGGLGFVSIAHSLKVARGGWPDSFGSKSPEGAIAPVESPTSESVMAEGRIVAYPGAQVKLSSEISGRITTLAVEERQQVHRGDLIAELACDETRAALDETKFKQTEAEAEIRYCETRIIAIHRMSSIQVASSLELLQCTRDLEVAQARLKQASAAIERLQAQLVKSRIVAPMDGTIIERSVEAGQVIDSQTTIATLADLSRTRVEAEVNEFDSGKVTPGTTAVVTAEGYPGAQWRAKVEEIPDVVVNRHLRPQDPGRPTDTGVLLVKLVLLDAAPLRLGQRVEVRIDPGPAPAKSTQKSE